MSDNYLMPYQWHSIIVCQRLSMACIFAYSMTIIMLALCLMLSGTYYAQNYASIIGWCLTLTPPSLENISSGIQLQST